MSNAWTGNQLLDMPKYVQSFPGAHSQPTVSPTGAAEVQALGWAYPFCWPAQHHCCCLASFSKSVLKHLCNSSYKELKIKEVAADSKAPSASDDHLSSLVRPWPTSGLMCTDLHLYRGADSTPLLACSRVTRSLSFCLHTCTIFLRCWGITWQKGRMKSFPHASSLSLLN